MAGLVKKGSVYYATFSFGKKTVWRRIGKVSHKDALKVKHKWESEIDIGNLGLIETKSIPFNSFIDPYLQYCKSNKSPKTVERDITSLKALSRFYGNTPLELINEQSIEQYKQKRLSDGVKPKTVVIELFCLSNALRRAIEWNYLKQLPKIQFLKYQCRPPRFLTEAEMQCLINAASPWLKPIVLVLRNTGLRVSELCRLEWSNVDFENNMITVMNSDLPPYNRSSI